MLLILIIASLCLDTVLSTELKIWLTVTFSSLFSGSIVETTQDRGDPNDPRVRLKRDCVGIMATFKLKHPCNRFVIVANTHLYW